MGAVSRKALADLRRRRLQSLVIGLVVFMAGTSATMALSTLIESQAPYDRAFAAADGAHLVIEYDGRLPLRTITATGGHEGVIATAGPWPVGQASLRIDLGGGPGGLFVPGGGTVSGRDRPDTDVDRIVVRSGRWWTAPGEIVVSERWAELNRAEIGDLIAADRGPKTSGGGDGELDGEPVSGPGFGPGFGPPVEPGSSRPSARTLRLVGIAASVSTPRVVAWMFPSDLAALDPDAVPAQQMFYRVDRATTDADLAEAVVAITGDMPTTSVLSAETYLGLKAAVDRTAGLFVPILLAFALFALLASGFIIVNTVSGIVLAEYRAIGIMKAIGYTPGQVRAVLLLDILGPVVIGAVAGTILGTLASQPVLAQTAHAFGLPAPFAASLPVIGMVVLAATTLAIVAALGPSTRASRLTVARALTRGAAPSTRADGGWLRRRALELPFPIDLRLGLAAGVAHRIRATMTLGALVIGVAALVFTAALEASLRQIAVDLIRDEASPVRVERRDPAVAAGPVTAILASDPKTARVVTLTEVQVSVPGLSGPVPLVGYDGDASWTGYALIAGRWFEALDEAVAPTNFFRQTRTRVGDTIQLRTGDRTLDVRLVGEIFDQPREARDGLVIRGHGAIANALDPTVEPTRWEVQPTAGVEPLAYAGELGARVGRGVGIEVVEDSATSEGFLLFEGVVAVLGVVLVTVSAAGVFNMVLLDTWRRTRDTAILKTIGMTTRQVIAMVVGTVLPVALVAGAVGVPAGLAMQRIVLGFMGEAASRTAVPSSAIDVLPPFVLVALAASGLVIAVLGACVPARRAALAAIAPVLQAE